MAETSTSDNTEFVAYEYTTVRAGRELEGLYKDSYRNFGWIIEGYGTNPTNVRTVTLKFKRDRSIKNRPVVLELQRKCENALTAITQMEHAKGTAANTAAMTIGIVGSAFLAGSVFALDADMLLVSVPLGAIGLIGWVLGYFSYGRVKATKIASLAPLIDRQYDVVYETGEQASRLLV